MLDFGANLELVSCLKHSPCDFSLWVELCINTEAGSKGKVEERERGGETEGKVERTVSDDGLAGMQHYLPWLLSIEAVTKSLPSSKSIGFPTWRGVAMLWRSSGTGRTAVGVLEGAFCHTHVCGSHHFLNLLPALPLTSPGTCWSLSFTYCWLWLRLTGRKGMYVVLF